MKITSIIVFFLSISIIFSILCATPRQMEYLNRGAVAVKVDAGIYLSWRFLGTDNPATGFNVYRDNIRINTIPITTSTNYTDILGTITSVYKVLPVLNGVEDVSNIKSVTPWERQYKTVKLNRPLNGKTLPNKYGSVGKAATGSYPQGQPYGYSPNDCSVGDVDGDGEYEIIVKWDPSNSQDNSYYGITGNVYLDAYKLDGTQLWRIDLGKNIRAGAHYTQFMVYDFDGDGLAEVVCKTAPGTKDAKGNYVIMNSDNPTADYRSIDTTITSGAKMLGTIQSGPEYLTLFDGKSGEELNTIAYNPARGSSSWGDNYGNRSDRFLACVAYLDGVQPSVVMCRGYYSRTTLVAYDIRNKKLLQRWFYDSGSTSGVGAYGQGNHNLSVADVDSDGKDEIIYGSCAINDDGTLLYQTGLGHGDAMHVSDMDPDNPGLEVWVAHEESTAKYGYELHDAKTGKILWGIFTGVDNGRGLAADIDAKHSGFEMWSGSVTYSCKGDIVSNARPSINFRMYWDGDLQDELLDGINITKCNISTSSVGVTTLLSCAGTSSCNSTKATPNLSADILGDWREEVILWETSDSSKIRIYTTTIPTNYRLFTPMHDPVYRLGVAWQNVAYNQPPHLGFYIGGGLTNVSQPDIKMMKYTESPTAIISPKTSKSIVTCNNKTLKIYSTETIQSVSVYSMSGRLQYQNNSVQSMEFTSKLPEKEYLFIVKIKTSSGSQIAKIRY
jgi:rhamnogalacturonan endolyase